FADARDRAGPRAAEPAANDSRLVRRSYLATHRRLPPKVLPRGFQRADRFGPRSADPFSAGCLESGPLGPRQQNALFSPLPGCGDFAHSHCRLMRLATYPAPKPLSMLTTETLLEQ